MERDLDRGLAAPAEEPRRDHPGIVEHQQIARPSSAGRSPMWRSSRRLRPDHQQPGGIARPHRMLRDQIGGQVEVEQIDAHRSRQSAQTGGALRRRSAALASLTGRKRRRAMPRQSAGLLMYRRRAGALEVFLVHPGGPFWAKKDQGAWSIPKGELRSRTRTRWPRRGASSRRRPGTVPEGEFVALDAAPPEGRQDRARLRVRGRLRPGDAREQRFRHGMAAALRTAAGVPGGRPRRLVSRWRRQSRSSSPPRSLWSRNWSGCWHAKTDEPIAPAREKVARTSPRVRLGADHSGASSPTRFQIDHAPARVPLRDRMQPAAGA